MRRQLILIVTCAVTAACTPVLPPIADVGNDAAFKSAIARRYGPGTPAAALRSDLLREGFTSAMSDVRGFRYSAVKAEPNLPCFSYVRVDWNEDGRGRISLIQASRLQCR